MVSAQSFPWIIITLAVVLVWGANLIWVAIETRPPHWDMGRHLWNSLRYYHEFSLHQILPFLQSYNYYPPLIYWLASPVYALFGASVMSAVSINLIFISVLTVSTYLLGVELWNKRVGLLAAILTLSYPMLVSQFKEYQVDAPLTALTTLSLYLLLKTKRFSSWRWSLAFGFAAGLALLTKWTFIAIIALPILLVAGLGLKNAWGSRGRIFILLQNLVVAASSAYITCSVWYVSNLQQLKIDLFGNNAAQAVREGDPMVGSLESTLWYFWNLINNQLYLIPFIAFLVALVITLRNKMAARRNLLLMVFILGIYIAFTFISNKDARYTLPMLPAIALITCSAITAIPSRKAQNIASILIGLHAATAFMVMSFGNSIVPQYIGFNLGNQSITVIKQGGYLIGAPTGEQWYQSHVVEIAASTPGKSLLFIGPESIWFNNWGLTYLSQRSGVVLTGNNPEIIIIRGNDQPPWKNYTPTETFTLPDGQALKLYRKTSEPYN